MLKQNHQVDEVLGIFNCSPKSARASTNSQFLAAKAVRILFVRKKLIILGFKYLGISPMIAVCWGQPKVLLTTAGPLAESISIVDLQYISGNLEAALE